MFTAKELANYRLQVGDILFNRTNGSRDLVGKCEVFDFPGDWAFASYLIRLRLDTELALPRFVAAFLNTYWGRRQVEHVSRQILMSNINAEEIRALRIPLPKPDVQRALLAQLDAARAARDAGLAEADALLAGLDTYVLTAMGLPTSVSDEQTRPFSVRFKDVNRDRFDVDFQKPLFRQLRQSIEQSQFDIAPVSAIFEPLATGFAAGAADQSDKEAGGIPHIRPLNIRPTGEITLEGTKRVPAVALRRGDLLTGGEILFNNTNSALWVGKSAVFDLDQPCAASNHITRLRLKDRRNDPRYFAALLNGLRSLGYFSILATNFNNQAGINSETLATLRLPVPRVDVQNALASEATRRRVEANRIRSAARRHWDDARGKFESALLGPDASGVAS